MTSIKYGYAQGRLAGAGSSALLRWSIALASLAAASCAIEGDEACGAHQVYKTGTGLLDYAVCVCDESEGYVFDAQRGYGCKRCPDDQVASGGKCVSAEPDGGTGDGSPEYDGGSQGEPTGAGEYCETADDCAAYDAKYCATTMRTCLVDKCATGEHACGSKAACCDFSHLATGFSFCVPDELLADGNCPMGGMKVDP